MKEKCCEPTTQYKRKARPLLFLSLFSFVCCYIYCVRTAKLFRRGWMSRWAAR